MSSEVLTRWFAVPAFAALLFFVSQAYALTIPEPYWRQGVASLRVGDKKKSVLEVMKQYGQGKSVKSLVDENRISRRAWGFLLGENALEWSMSMSTPEETTYSMAHIIAVFSEKQDLLDLFEFDPRDRVAVPLIDGKYAQGLRALGKGARMQDVFLRFGKTNPDDYHQDSGGRWILEFLYNGYPEKVWKLSVDAGSGIVIKKEHVAPNDSGDIVPVNAEQN